MLAPTSAQPAMQQDSPGGRCSSPSAVSAQDSSRGGWQGENDLGTLPWSTNPGARWVCRMGREVMRAVGHPECPCSSCAPSPSSKAQDQREWISAIRPCHHPGCAGAGDHPALRGPRISPSPGGVEPGAPAPASPHHEVRRVLGAGGHHLLGFCVSLEGCQVQGGTQLLGRER